ncbi:hypothetical protein HYG81_07005 [Natrinema zhouii]|uniref:Uncharacterized protein n=1 Tax=Natrinema zhouii TaxID=1710539 RepID=A0A7D6GSZ6_9EURY|nr:hypothetical protein [Natrinema zhouii]QLK27343.1 hypothetical protein HYG81_07005 [Natrinema zhouii]
MNRPLVYHASQMIVGGGFLLFAVASVLGDGFDDTFHGIIATMMVISGGGITLVNGYQLLRSDADSVELTPALFRLSVVGAGLMVLGVILQVAL